MNGLRIIGMELTEAEAESLLDSVDEDGGPFGTISTTPTRYASRRAALRTTTIQL